jgi:hypothetical protein
VFGPVVADDSNQDASSLTAEHRNDLVAGCSAPLTCDVAGGSVLDPRQLMTRIIQIVTLAGLLAAGAGCVVMMLAGVGYVLITAVLG